MRPFNWFESISRYNWKKFQETNKTYKDMKRYLFTYERNGNKESFIYEMFPGMMSAKMYAFFMMYDSLMNYKEVVYKLMK